MVHAMVTIASQTAVKSDRASPAYECLRYPDGALPARALNKRRQPCLLAIHTRQLWGSAIILSLYCQARAEAVDLEALAQDDNEDTALQQLAHEEGEALRARVCPESTPLICGFLHKSMGSLTWYRLRDMTGSHLTGS